MQALQCKMVFKFLFIQQEDQKLKIMVLVHIGVIGEVAAHTMAVM